MNDSSQYRLTVAVDQYQKEVDELLSAHTPSETAQPALKLQPIEKPLSPEFFQTIRKQTQPQKPALQQLQFDQDPVVRQPMSAPVQLGPQFTFSGPQSAYPGYYAPQLGESGYQQQPYPQSQYQQSPNQSINRPLEPSMRRNPSQMSYASADSDMQSPIQSQSSQLPLQPRTVDRKQSASPSPSQIPSRPSSPQYDQSLPRQPSPQYDQSLPRQPSPQYDQNLPRQPSPLYDQSIPRQQSPAPNNNQPRLSSPLPERQGTPKLDKSTNNRPSQGQKVEKVSSESALKSKAFRNSEIPKSASTKELPLRKNASLNELNQLKDNKPQDFYQSKKITKSNRIVAESLGSGIYARKKIVSDLKAGRKMRKIKSIDMLDQPEVESESEDSDFGYYSYASEDEEAVLIMKQTADYDFYTYSDESDAEVEIEMAKQKLKERPPRKTTTADLDLFVATDGTPIQVKKKKLTKSSDAKEPDSKDLTTYEMRKQNKRSLFLNSKPLDPRRVKGVHKGLHYRGKPAKRQTTAEEKILQKYDGTMDEPLIPAQKIQGQRKVPKALYDPKVRKQLAKVKTYYPYFTYLIMLINTVVMIYELVFSYQLTGAFISTSPFNIMIGPSAEVLVQMGARFVPCMKDNRYANQTTFCLNGIHSSITNATLAQGGTRTECTWSDYCGLGGFTAPSQWWRIITPIFMHGGVVHYLLNTAFFYQVGPPMEETYGTWKMAFIYMVSGVAGFLFGADLVMLSPVVGASGSIYGIMAIVLLDLILNFQLVENKWKELRGLVIQIVASLAFGLLPYIDNFAHIGGFITGILCGFMLMQSITISTFDKYGKLALRLFAVPCLVAFLAWLSISFFGGGGASECTWCKYLDCIPVNGWCEGYSQ